MAWQSDNSQQVLVVAQMVFKEAEDSDSAGHADSGMGGDTPMNTNAHIPMRKVTTARNERSPPAAQPVVVAGKDSHGYDFVPTAVPHALENGRAAMAPVLERTPPHLRDEAARAMSRSFMVAGEEVEECSFAREVMGTDVEKTRVQSDILRAVGVTCEAKTPSREGLWSPSCSEETASHTTDASPFRQDISPGPPESSSMGRGALFPVEPMPPLDAASTFLLPPLIDECEELEEASFLPPSLRSGKQSAMDKWSKRDLFLHEDGEIARGSFAKVITVTKGVEGIVLAVKAIPQNLPERGPQEEYIAREVELLKICGVHPNVIGFLGCMKTSEMAFVIMPLASTDVKKLVKERGPLGEEEVVALTQQFASALEFVHGKRIIHRDLKPANLLLTPGSTELKVLLADFGVAKMLPDGEDSMTGVCGTEPYMSPEQVSRAEYSTQADMWAAGVVTYEMLHGVTPFCPKERAAAGSDPSRDSMAALQEKSNILSGEYDVDPRRVGETGADFISHLLTPSPSLRMPARLAGEHDWLGGAMEAAVRRAATAAAVAQEEAAQAADKASRLRLQKRARRPRRTSPRQV